MLVNLVKVRIKPEKRQLFLQAIEHDALASERDEPGCLRFNVIRDTQDENVYFFYEVSVDQAALGAHRTMPHFEVWRAAAAEALDGAAERTPCETVFPADRAYWGKA
ncbi:MAG TPA: putative quinol monooxygenase [Chloroflexota bacterium]|nr:putative quinol monooxygenase [Chloroflexota bacterium]